MPGGLVHLVFSVKRNGFKPTSVLMSGSHFLSEHSLTRMLDAAISHSLWHDVWTNATHDDVIAHVDWMLHSLLIRSSDRRPTQVYEPQQVYALLTYASLAPWLSSLPHQLNHGNPTWLETFDPTRDLEDRLSQDASTAAATARTLDILEGLRCKAAACVALLHNQEHRLFNAFWAASRQSLANEMKAQTAYNLRHS